MDTTWASGGTKTGPRGLESREAAVYSAKSQMRTSQMI